MNYIIDVKAQLLNDGGNLKTQYSAVKKNIERQVINVKAVLDPNELSLKAIQKQLNEQKLTLNIANVEFNQSGMNVATNAVKNATGKIEESVKQATNAVKELSHAYSELSKQDVYDALNSGSILKNGSAMSFGEKGTLKSIPQEERLFELAKIKKSFEETFGKTNVEVAGITNIDGALQRFIITAKNAKDEVLKFEYGLKVLKEKTKDAEGNKIKKNIGGQFQYTGGTFGESSIRETEKALRELVREEEKLNKELERQRSIYAELKSAVESIAVTRSGGKGKLEGFNTDETTKQMTLANDGTVEVTTAMKQYETASKNAIEALNNFDTAIKGNNTNTKEYVSTIKTAIDEMRAYGKVIHDQQSGSVGNMGEKDVKALKEAADFQLKTFEERVNSSGLVTDEFAKKIADLKTQLSGVKISDDYTKFTDQFRVIKAEFDNLTQSAKSATAAVSNTESFTQLTTKYDNLIDKASKYEGILESLSGEIKRAIASFAEIRNDGVVNENSLKQARAYYNTIKTEIDSVIAKREKERRAYEREQQKLANQRNFGINFTNASTDLDNLVKKIKELDIDESKLTYSTKDLYESFDSISDTKGLQALKSMISQTTKEVNEQQKAFEVEKAKIGELVKLQEQITSQQTKIANAELSGKNHNDIDIMKNKLEELEVTYEKLVTEFVSNPLFLKLTTSDLEPLNNASGNNEYVNNILNAKKQEEAWYQKILSVQKEIFYTLEKENQLKANSSLYDEEQIQRCSSVIATLRKKRDILQESAKNILTENQYQEVQNRLYKEALKDLEKKETLEDSVRKSAAKEADSMFSDIDKNTNKATDSLTNAKNIEILYSEYTKVIEVIKKYKSIKDDITSNAISSFVPNQREAVEAVNNYKELIAILLNAESKFKSVGNSLEQLDKQTSGGVFSANSTDKSVIALNEKIEMLKNNYQGLMTEFNDVGATNEVIQGFDNLAKEIDSTSQKANELNKTFKSTRTETTLISQKQSLNKSIETWLKNNTKASEAMKQSMKALQVQIESADNQSLKNLRNEFKRLKDVADATGQTGMRTLDNLNEKIGKFSSWFGVSQFIMGAVNDTKEAIVTLKEVDSMLTEISKTSDMSEESLKRLGNTAFESANQYGVTVQSFLTGVQEMSRAGYQDAEGMANLSILAQAAGDMTEEVADKYLIATDAAYKFNGSIDDLGKVLDGQNQITNRYAISMTDMASATQEAASMAANYGVSIEQLSALITTAVASTRQSGSEVGNALSTLFVNLSDTTNKERMKAFDTLGVSVYKFVDGAQRLKTPIELLDELATVFNRLEEGDPNRALLLNEIGGKHHANTLAAILSDWQKMDSIMNTYYSGFGSAEIEAAKSANNLQGSLNKLNNSFTDLVQNVVNTDFLTTLVQIVNDLTNGIDFLVEKIGLIPTVLSGVGIGALVKNGGRVKCLSSTICRHLNCFLLIGKFLFQTLMKYIKVNGNFITLSV